MYILSYQPLFYINLCSFRSKERGSVKDQKQLNAIRVNMNVIFYNLIHVSSNKTVNMDSKSMSIHKGQ